MSTSLDNKKKTDERNSSGGFKARFSSFALDRYYRIFLIMVIAAAAGLLFFGLNDAYDGFHGFQEAWYAAIAENYPGQSFFLPTTYDGILDLNVPPFFSYLLYLSFSLFRPSEAAARIVPILFSLMAIAGVYVLGESIMRRGAGLEAAALFATTPVFLVLGRSVQTDVVFVAFSLFWLYFYIKARNSGRISSYLVAGILLGLALFTKQFAIVPTAAVVVWELLGPERKNLLSKGFFVFVAAAALVITPYYGYHLLNDPERLLSAQLRGSASQAGLATGSTLSFLFTEIVWACSPLFLVGAFAGAGTGLIQTKSRDKDMLSVAKSRSSGIIKNYGPRILGPARAGDCPQSERWLAKSRDSLRILVFLNAAFFFAFFLFLHRHSYYVFGAVPFLVLLFTQLHEKLPRKVYSSLVIATALSAIMLSAYTLAGSEYGRGEFKNLGLKLQQYQQPVVIGDNSFYYNYAPLFRYYCKNTTLLLRGPQLTSSESEVLKQSDGVFEPSDVPMGSLGNQSIPIKGIRYGLKFNGKVYIHIPPNIHFFAPAAPTELTDYRIIGSFGPLVKLEQTSFFLNRR